MLKFLFRSVALGALVVAGAGSYGYYRWAASKLPNPGGADVSTRLVGGTPSLSGGALPVTFEAYLKSPKEQNFLESGHAIGLVSARYEWSHGAQAWVLDDAFAARQASDIEARKRLAHRWIEDLLADLASDDIARREIASKELLIRTGMTEGYRYDAPKADRERAIGEWKKWWANDDNKKKYAAKRFLDEGQKALDTLRKVIGEPSDTPPR